MRKVFVVVDTAKSLRERDPPLSVTRSHWPVPCFGHVDRQLFHELPDATNKMSQSPPLSPPASQRGPLVLIVDDDARSARLIAQMLREDGFNVEVALDGARAIARLTQSPLPDVLVTDLAMPHADGNSVTKFARTQKPGLPVIFVTGYPHLAASLSGPPTPTLFTKPVDYTELKKALITLLPRPELA